MPTGETGVVPKRLGPHCLHFCVWVAGLIQVVTPSAADEVFDATLVGRYRDLNKQLRGLDWETQHEFIARAIDNIWEQNNWNDEANQYAKALVTEVAAVPPWDLMARFNLFSKRVAERYQLSPDQTARFQGALVREAGGLLIRHTGLILEQTVEVLRTRSAERPFTVEQAARWTKESDPLLRDARESVDRLVEELLVTLTPEQRKIMQRDVSAFDERWKVLGEMRARWARGEWDPIDWGLQDDPIQRAAGDGHTRRIGRLLDEAELPGEVNGTKLLPRWVDHDYSTWLAYVADFGRRYRLDAGQMSAARSIHGELVARAATYSKPLIKQLDAVPVAKRSTHELYAQILTLFLELRTRLSAIPTTAQRVQGGP